MIIQMVSRGWKRKDLSVGSNELLLWRKRVHRFEDLQELLPWRLTKNKHWILNDRMILQMVSSSCFVFFWHSLTFHFLSFFSLSTHPPSFWKVKNTLIILFGGGNYFYYRNSLVVEFTWWWKLLLLSKLFGGGNYFIIAVELLSNCREDFGLQS